MIFDLFKTNPHLNDSRNNVNSQAVVNAGLNIPKDPEDFLRKGKELGYNRFSCEAGLITLTKLQDLKVEKIRISTKMFPE